MFDFFRGRRSVPVSILTGFLGSGKTTTLNYLLTHAEMADTAVLINEFGEVGIDHLITEHVDEKMMILSAGCICCTVRGDILLSLKDLFERRARKEIPFFRRIVVETTGLADPAPVVHALLASEGARSKVHLDTIATVVDTSHGLKTLERHPEAVTQVALADILLLSKTDLVDEDTVEALEVHLRSINPRAGRKRSEFGRVSAELLFGRDALDPRQKRLDLDQWLGAPEGRNDHHAHHDAPVRTWTLVRDEPMSDDEFRRLCAMLENLGGEDLLRVKGIVHVEPNRAMLVHAVQHAFHPPKRMKRMRHTDGTPQSTLVFITRGLEPDDLTYVARGFRRLHL